MYQLLRNTSCKSEFLPIKRLIIFHVNLSCHVIAFLLYHQLMMQMLMSSSCVLVVKSHSRPLRVSVLKAPTIFTLNTVSLPNVCNVVSRISPTYCPCEAPQYKHTVIVNNAANTSYSRHEMILCFLQPGTDFTRSSLTSSSPTLLSIFCLISS